MAADCSTYSSSKARARLLTYYWRKEVVLLRTALTNAPLAKLQRHWSRGLAKGLKSSPLTQHHAARISFMHPSSHTTPFQPIHAVQRQAATRRSEHSFSRPHTHSCSPSHRVRLQHNIGQLASRVISRVTQQIHHLSPLLPVLHQSATWLSEGPGHSLLPRHSLWYSHML